MVLAVDLGDPSAVMAAACCPPSSEGLVDAVRLGGQALAMAAVQVGSYSTIHVQNLLAVAGWGARTLAHFSVHRKDCSQKTALVGRGALARWGLELIGFEGYPLHQNLAGSALRLLVARFRGLACRLDPASCRCRLGSVRSDPAWNPVAVVVGALSQTLPAW